MIQQERQQTIVKLLEKTEFISIRELAKALYSSEASIRRDISALEQEGIVTHVRGGVTLSKFQNTIVPILYRDQDNAPNKELIAKKAAERVRNGNTLFIDASSTARRIVKYLGNLKNLKIITNNQQLFNEGTSPQIRLYCTGGMYCPENHCFTGPAAEAYIRSVYADIVFFSSQGLSEDGDITDVSEEETALRRAMLAHAKYKIFLCDTSKLGVQKIFRLCNKSEIDEIISNDDSLFNIE